MTTTMTSSYRTGALRIAGSLALCVLACSPAFAAPFSSDGMTINIPAGFEGPVTQSNTGATQFVFTKQSSAPDIQTLLQITISSPRNEAELIVLGKEELANRSEKYANDLIKVFEEMRTDFVRGNAVHLQLGGQPATKIPWKGKVDDISANGVMYCVIVNGKLVSLHTQDVGNDATANMRAAIKAFETLKVKAPALPKKQ